MQRASIEDYSCFFTNVIVTKYKQCHGNTYFATLGGRLSENKPVFHQSYNQTV